MEGLLEVRWHGRVDKVPRRLPSCWRNLLLTQVNSFRLFLSTDRNGWVRRYSLYPYFR